MMMMMVMIGYLVEGVVREEEPQRGLGAICRHTLLADALVPVIRAAAPDLFPIEVVGSPVGLLPHLAAQGYDLESTLLLCGEPQQTLPKPITQDKLTVAIPRPRDALTGPRLATLRRQF